MASIGDTIEKKSIKNLAKKYREGQHPPIMLCGKKHIAGIRDII